MVESPQTRILVDEVYNRILRTLNDRVALTPERLPVSGIARKLGVSRTPVTMALVRLECDGLVRRRANGGWYTRSLRLEDIEEIFELKEALAPLFMSKAAERITPEEAEELLKLVEQLEKAVHLNDVDGWLEADRSYHDLLLRVISNTRYEQIQDQLSSQIYRLRVGQMVLKERMAVSAVQHRQMAEAVAANDPQLAARVTLEHLRSLKASLVHLVKEILIPVMGREGGFLGTEPALEYPGARD